MSQTKTRALDRRKVLAGAGTAGALGAAAALLPATRAGGETAPATASSTAQDAADAGYRLTEHVKRYYQTARV